MIIKQGLGNSQRVHWEIELPDVVSVQEHSRTDKAPFEVLLGMKPCKRLDPLKPNLE